MDQFGAMRNDLDSDLEVWETDPGHLDMDLS